MKEVLFVCEGNVGRSQMAEGFYKHHKGMNSATSAGTADVGAKYNYVPREDIILAMQEKGVDISAQRIKQITEQMLDEVESIVVLCDPNLLPPFLQTSGLNILFRQVADPYESSMDGVRQIRDSIEKIILDLIAQSENKYDE